MTPTEALNNFKIIGEKYCGPLAHHLAIGESVAVLRQFVEEHTPKESAGVVEEPSNDYNSPVSEVGKSTPRKSPKKPKARKK